MAQYIDKSALVAEIEKLKDKVSDSSSYCNGWQHALRMLELSIDTLEVKEVDLDKEIDNFYGMYRKNGITFSIEDNQECLDWKVDCNPDFEKEFAKHFFELGLKTQKEE